MVMGVPVAFALTLAFFGDDGARPDVDEAPSGAAPAIGRASETPTLGAESPVGGTGKPVVVPAPLPTPASLGPTPTPAALRAVVHVVAPGQVLSAIAESYGISPETLMWANPDMGDPDLLQVGQTLVIPPVTGVLHEVTEGDTLNYLAAYYRAEVAPIAEANRLEPPFVINIGQLLVVPGGKPPEPTPTPQPIVAVHEPPRAPPSTRGAPPDSPPSESPAPTAVPRPDLDAHQTAFIEHMLGPALRSQRENGIPASVTIAQAILESNWGRAGLASKYHNYFGIKARPRPGPAGTVWLDTWEHVNGRDIVVKEPFRVYHNVEESVMDHGVYLRDSPRYAEAMRNIHDPKLFVQLVHKVGYATDPNYSAKVIRIMDRYDLYVYDTP